MITQSEREWGLTYAPYVTCPRCHAGKSKACTQPNGDTTQTHKERIGLATFYPAFGTTLTPTEAATRLGVSAETVRIWARAGVTPAMKDGPGARAKWLVDAAWVDQRASRKR